MSLIDDTELRRFWEERVVPAATRLRERGVVFFPTGPDAEGATWYHGPPQEPPDFVELGDEGECLRQLASLWERQGLPELVELAGPLRALAESLRPVVKESGTISPDIYVMY